MNKLKLTLFLIIIGCKATVAQITPEIYSWVLNATNDLGYNNIPSNVLKVQYSTNNVYVKANCIPGYDIGPWAGNPNTAANQDFQFKITRKPIKNSGTITATGLGHIGIFINGVSMYNPKDAMSYNNKGVWFQNAIVVEGPSFDNCLGHPAGNGEYHHHLNPTCLYNDSLTTAHSPIVGYAFDGFPVYGPFAYSDTNGSGSIVRMKTSYRKRNITDRTKLPNGNTASFAGPTVNTQYPLGYYIEDFEYVTGLGTLDEHNGRYCKTPEYPNGTYCYFVTLDSQLIPEFPYLIGNSYYGIVQSGNTGPGSGHNVISESVVEYTGINAIQTHSEAWFSIHPNPGCYQLNISFTNPDISTQISIIDISGKVIYTLNNSTFLHTIQVNMDGLTKGMYWVTVNTNNGSQTMPWLLN